MVTHNKSDLGYTTTKTCCTSMVPEQKLYQQCLCCNVNAATNRSCCVMASLQPPHVIPPE